MAGGIHNLIGSLVILPVLGAGGPGAVPLLGSDQPMAQAGRVETKESQAGPAGKPWRLPMTPAQIRKLLAEAVREQPGSFAPEVSLSFDLRGRDLAGLDLRDADLRRRDLRGWRLEGMDLTGANLEEANLPGVSLKGARLFGASTVFAKGLDLTGAQVHPFFMPGAGEPLGAIRWLDTEEGGRSGTVPPPGLVSGSDFALIFILPDGSQRKAITATGAGYYLGRAPDPRNTFLGLAVDARNTLWTLDRRKVHTHARWSSRLEDGGADLQSALHQIPMERMGELRSLQASRKGGLDLAFAHAFVILRKSGDQLGMMEFPYPKGFEGSQGLSTRDGKDLVIACRDLDRLLLTRPGEGRYRTVPLPAGTACEGLALGPGGEVWFTFTGKGGHGIGILDPPSLSATLAFLPPPTVGPELRRLGALALGPDGKSMWVCDGGGRIGRVRLGRGRLDLREFALPDGDRPLKIVPFAKDRMLFTLEGRSRIGSIRALEPVAPAGDQGTGAGEQAKGDLATSGQPRPAPARMTSRDRRERTLRHILREPGPAAGAETKASAGEAPEADRKDDPGALLQDLGVILSESALRHILGGHGYDRNPQKSQFAPAYSSREALTALLARGMDDSGAIGRIRSTTLRGSCKTLCRADGAGFVHDGKGWVATDWFVVITSLSMDGSVHIVETAHPVDPRGI